MEHGNAATVNRKCRLTIVQLHGIRHAIVYIRLRAANQQIQISSFTRSTVGTFLRRIAHMIYFVQIVEKTKHNTAKNVSSSGLELDYVHLSIHRENSFAAQVSK
jgi:hypothetical protein